MFPASPTRVADRHLTPTSGQPANRTLPTIRLPSGWHEVRGHNRMRAWNWEPAGSDLLFHIIENDDGDPGDRLSQGFLYGLLVRDPDGNVWSYKTRAKYFGTLEQVAKDALTWWQKGPPETMADVFPRKDMFRQTSLRLIRAADLTGMTRRKVVDMVNHVIERAPTKGVHRDQYWRPVQAIWKGLEKADIPFGITKSDYEQEVIGGRRVPVRKVWRFEVPFTSERGRPGVVYGQVIAAGAGPVDSPLDAYDVTAYAS